MSDNLLELCGNSYIHFDSISFLDSCSLCESSRSSIPRAVGTRNCSVWARAKSNTHKYICIFQNSFIFFDERNLPNPRLLVVYQTIILVGSYTSQMISDVLPRFLPSTISWFVNYYTRTIQPKPTLSFVFPWILLVDWCFGAIFSKFCFNGIRFFCCSPAWRWKKFQPCMWMVWGLRGHAIQTCPMGLRFVSCGWWWWGQFLEV